MLVLIDVLTCLFVPSFPHSTKRAVVVLNIIFVVLNILGIFSWISYKAIAEKDNSGLTADQINFIITFYPYMLAIYGISIAFNAAALIGAIKYNVCLIVMAIVWFIISFCWEAWTNITAGYPINVVISAFFTALWIYPHAVFVHEMNSGEQRSIHSRKGAEINTDQIVHLLIQTSNRCNHKRDLRAPVLLLCVKFSRYTWTGKIT